MRRTQKHLLEENTLFKIHQNEDKLWIGYRICPECGDDITHSSYAIWLLRRNIRNAIHAKKPCLSCAMTGDGNSFYGRKHSERTKRQVSKSRAGKAKGKNNAMANPEYRKKASDMLKKKWASGDLDYLKKEFGERLKKNIETGKIKICNISKDEKKLKKILKKYFDVVIQQHPIKSFKYDFYIPSKNLLIEYNGDYWHCNPTKYEYDYFHEVKKMTARQLWEMDDRKQKLAINNGYKFITIWEKDFNKNPKQEIKKITQI